MNLFFTFSDNFQSNLTETDLLKILDKLNEKSTKVISWKVKDYHVKVKFPVFEIQWLMNTHRTGPLYPKIIGKVLSDEPLLINIKIIPHYWYFIVVLIANLSVFIFSNETNTTIFLCGLLNVLYITTVLNSVSQSKRWICKKLNLKALSTV